MLRIMAHKWLKWTLIVVLIIAVGIAAFLIYKNVFAIKMDATMADRAKASLANGITVEDAHGDFADMGGPKESSGRLNNLNPYNIGYCDIKSVTTSIDNQYFYYKVKFWGNIPSKAPVFNGDKMKGCGVKLNIGSKEKEEQAILYTGYGYLVGVPVLGTYYFHGPTGIREPESARYEGQARDSFVSGGFGTDYLIGAFPLKNLTVKKGDTIYYDVQIEAESKKYVHAAVDTLGSSGKTGSEIIWDTQKNEFQIDSNFFENTGSDK